MSTQIKYINYFDEEITSQQASQLDQYTEQTYIDERLKKVNHFYENELEYVDIYVYPDEDENSILSSLQANIEYSIVKDLVEINGYTIWKYFHYENGVLDNTEYTTEVLDDEGRIVASRTYNADGTIQRKGYKKYHIGGNVLYADDGEVDIGYADDDYIKFDFSGDSLEIRITFDDGGTFTSLDRFLRSWEENLPFMTPEILAYFTNLDPLVPDAGVIV